MFNLKKSPVYFMLVAFVSVVFVTACKKEEAIVQLSDTQKVELAQQSLKASMFFTSSFTQATKASTKANGLKEGDKNVLQERGACTAPTVLPADLFTFPKTVTSNYGTGCTDLDGKLKTGKLTLKVGKFWESGSTIQAIFENFTEDGAKLDGTYSIINNSTLGVVNYTFSADNISLTSKEGKTVSYNIRQTHKQVGGFGNFDPLDDVYDIATVLTSTLPDGTKFSWENATPLKKTNACWWIQKGTGTIKVNDVPMAIDFGNDTCDDEASITLGGVVYKIKL
jgi:hypothetical protein